MQTWYVHQRLNTGYHCKDASYDIAISTSPDPTWYVVRGIFKVEVKIKYAVIEKAVRKVTKQSQEIRK